MPDSEPTKIAGALEEEFRLLLPETYEIVASSNLTAHSAVRSVVLSGSRGLGGSPRTDSDIDLSFVVESGCTESCSDRGELDELLSSVLKVAAISWVSAVELDCAAIYDTRMCGLRCFDGGSGDAQCSSHGEDCFGVYKTSKGFGGFVSNVGLEVKKARPMTVIWRRREPAQPAGGRSP
jgi:hypothetical protein